MVEDKKEKNRGFIALVALLIVASVALTFGITANMSGFNELKNALASGQVVGARALARSCVEDGLESLRNNFVAKNESLSNQAGSCILNVVVNGNNAILSAIGTVDIYNQKIEVTVDNNLNVISWQED
ncbi:MAG: hypothetical protein JW816_03475 [Candidatus Buchananbacteria bacterium]|nr:hypothetical protein [Candidatus Buchananbacteria bacterium]